MEMGITMLPIQASVLLLTYNQEGFVQEALQSLLAQDYDNLEIVVSDDGSKYNTWLIIQKMALEYKGSKKIILNRNDLNLGIVGNYNKAYLLSSGDLIFTAAGDDISLPTRCSACIQYWLSFEGKPDLIATDGYDMNTNGDVLGEKLTDSLDDWNLLRWSERRPFMFGASHMMTRRLIGLRLLSCRLAVEDQNFLVRALMMGGARRLPLLLIKHRRGGFSQRKTRWTYELKKSAMIKSSQDALYEIDEISKDAKLLNIEMEYLLERQRVLNTYVLSIFSCSGVFEKIKMTVKYNNLSLSKRLKFFSFASLPHFYSFIFLLKIFVK